jgi:hypothetical protein
MHVTVLFVDTGGRPLSGSRPEGRAAAAAARRRPRCPSSVSPSDRRPHSRPSCSRPTACASKAATPGSSPGRTVFVIGPSRRTMTASRTDLVCVVRRDGSDQAAGGRGHRRVRARGVGPQREPKTGTNRCARGEDPSKLLVFLAVGRQAGVVSASCPADKLQYHLRPFDSFSQPRPAARSLECTRASGGTATGLTAE